MIAVIIIGVGLFLFSAIAGIGYFSYSLITKNKNMHTDHKTKALDIFMYLGIGISLVVSVYNILQIVFTAIDRKFPDSMSVSISSDIYSSDVRMAIALLMVMYPLYIALSWYVAKDISKFTYKRDLMIRKIMIYATLFITVCTLIGTLVSLIYNYLGGDLSIPFALKALTVFVVALSLFGYYFYLMRRDYSKKSSVPMVATIVATITVVSSLVWSVMIIGTPAEMRAKRIDSTRLSNLSSIQQEIFNYFQTANKLPESLSELNNAFQGFAVPIDPITKEVYGYNIIEQPIIKINDVTKKKEMTSSAVFEICANFDIVRDNRGQGVTAVPAVGKTSISIMDAPYSVSNYYYEYDQSPFWNHGVGNVCFKRIISPEMYYGN